jgi:endoglucanase
VNEKFICRRHFLRETALLAGLGVSVTTAEDALASGTKATLPKATAAKLPPWRGVNLLEKFMMPENKRYLETDFAWLQELGFNFVRLPMDYRCWIDGNDWTTFREDTFKEIDEAVAFGEKYGIHVLLCFCRAPGHAGGEPKEPKDLWTDDEAQRVCAMHWSRFAERYQGIPNTRLSFNLFNEPVQIPQEVHRHVVERMVEAIRAHDKERLIICDGRNYGRTAPKELLGLDVAAATHCYDPYPMTHYKAPWAKDSDKFDPPTYPMKDIGVVWNKEYLGRRMASWKELQSKHMGVMVGEFGAFNKTPHALVLSWMRDCLDLWKDAGWGWALWNFRGSFGFLDSERSDVKYEDFHGQKLDRAMLEVLKVGM